MKLGISHVEIVWAFEQRGCPVCFLIRRTEERYLFGFAWEQVTDASFAHTRW